jgi:hypothetical protein
MTLAQRMMMKRLRGPAKTEGDDLPGDYGDDFTPTDDTPAPTPDPKAEPKPKADPDPNADPNADPDADPDADPSADPSADPNADPDAEGLRGAVEDAAATDEAKKDTGTPKVGKGKFIPLDRHEKLLKKERARREELEAQLAQSRTGAEVAKVNDQLTGIEDELVAMEEKYNELLAEGDTKQAAVMMTQIRRKNAELNAIASEQRDAEIMARAVEKVRYDEALERIEEAYPALNPTNEEFDEDVLQDVVDLMRAGQRRGLSPTKALQRAVARTLGADTGGQKSATTTTPRVDEKDVAADVAAQRRSDAVKRNIDAAKRTPPATHRVGAGNDVAGGALTAKTIMNMSEAEFEKLSETDLARARGDYV